MKFVNSKIDKLSIGGKVAVLLLVMLLIGGVNIAVVYYYLSQGDKDADAIDVAGGQRMLSQRMAWVSFMLADGHSDQTIMKDAIDTYDMRLNVLEKGGAHGEHELNPAPEEVSDEIERNREVWAEYKTHAENVINYPPYNPEFLSAVKFLEDNNDELLKKSDAIVQVYAGLENSGEYSREIDVSGRQRMLTQQITKQAMLISEASSELGVDAGDKLVRQDSQNMKQYRADLKTYITGYDSALKALEYGGLYKGNALKPAPSAVLPAIAEVKVLWVSFKPHADTVTTTSQLNPTFWNSLEFIEKNSDGLRSASNDVVVELTRVSNERVIFMKTLMIVLLGLSALIFARGYSAVSTVIGAPLKYITGEARRLSSGDLSTRELKDAERSDEIGELSRAFREILENVARPVQELGSAAQRIAEGDLTQKVDIKARGDIQKLVASFGTMVESLQQLIGNIKGNADFTASAAEEMAASAEEVNASMTEVSSTIQEVSSRALSVSKSASESLEKSRETGESAQAGSKAAEDVEGKMSLIGETTSAGAEKIKALGEKSDEVGKIVGVIAGIADQTNLLALNAAIEAARAGDAGRGFAVVAEEVRNLAKESGRASGQIAELIGGIQEEIQGAVETMNENSAQVEEGNIAVKEALSSFRAMPALISGVVSSIDEIASASNENASGAQEVSASTEEVTAAMEEISASAQQLSDGAIDLQHMVAQFEVDGRGDGVQKRQAPRAAIEKPKGNGNGKKKWARAKEEMN